MKKVVVTGYGIISCIGNSRKDVIESLTKGKSGICYNEAYFEMGMSKPGDRRRLTQLILGELERKNQSGRFD